MFGTLLDVVSSGVVGDKISPDNIPDGYINIKNSPLTIWGIIIAICICIVVGIFIGYKFHKMLNFNMNESNNDKDEESDE
jgi:hypothetical protein